MYGRVRQPKALEMNLEKYQLFVPIVESERKLNGFSKNNISQNSILGITLKEGIIT